MKDIIKSYGGTVLLILGTLIVVVQIARRSATVRNWFTV